MNRLNVIVCLLILMLSGCGGESVPSDGETGGGNGGGTISPPPVVPPSSESIRAVNFHKTLPLNPKVSRVNINLSVFVHNESAHSRYLDSVTPMSNSSLCQVVDIEGKMLQFSVSPQNASGCVYKYTVSNGDETSTAYANVVVSADPQGLQAKRQKSTAPSLLLLPIEHNMALHDSLSVNLVDDGFVDTSGMTHPLFSEAVVTYGNGNAILKENGQFDYEAVSVGTTQITYYILDDRNTLDDGDDVVYRGTITISVSGNDNTPPQTLDKDTLTPVSIGVGEESTIDILSYPSEDGNIPLVTDVEGDELQLVFVSSENIDAYIEPVKLEDVTNTTFKIKGLERGDYLIDYVVYDHNEDGVAHGQIPVTVTDTLTGEIAFSLEGYLKLFKDGTLGVVPNSNSYDLDAIVKDANDILKANNVEATKMSSVGMGLYWINTTDKDLSVIVGTSEAKLFNRVKQVYGGGFYSMRNDGSNIVYLLFNDGHVESYSQRYYMNTNIVTQFPDVFNDLPLEERSNVESITYYTYSLVKFKYSDGKERVLSFSFDFDTTTSSSKWLDESLDVNDINFGDCLVNNKVEQTYYRNGVEAYLMINSDSGRDSSCFLSQEGSVTSNFEQLKEINDNEGVVDMKFLSLSSSPSAVLTKDNKLYIANNYFESWSETALDVVNFTVNASSVIYRHSDDKINIYSTKRCVSGFTLDDEEALETSSSECQEGEADISPNLDNLPIGYDENVRFYKVTSDAIGLLYNDGSLAFITARGYVKVNGNYSWLSGDVNISSVGIYFDKNSWYQGSNLFSAYNIEESKWELFNPLEGWNNEFQCVIEDNVLNSDGLVDVVILNGIFPLDGSEQPCPVYAFYDNGTQGNEALNTYAYPIDKFQDSQYYLPLTDIDNDGIDNMLELGMCVSQQAGVDKKHHNYWCSSPALSDSDFDGVADAFEESYSEDDVLRYLTDSSHLMLSLPLSIAPKDAFKDINDNGLADWLEE